MAVVSKVAMSWPCRTDWPTSTATEVTRAASTGPIAYSSPCANPTTVVPVRRSRQTMTASATETPKTSQGPKRTLKVSNA
jgi:hypothetical protein